VTDLVEEADGDTTVKSNCPSGRRVTAVTVASVRISIGSKGEGNKRGMKRDVEAEAFLTQSHLLCLVCKCCGEEHRRESCRSCLKQTRFEVHCVSLSCQLLAGVNGRSVKATYHSLDLFSRFLELSDL